MLNELYDLKTSMQTAGITVESWHKDYGSCPNYKTFYMLLDRDGKVVDLEPIAEREKIKALRKWEVSNGISFPVFNVLPLLHAKSPEGKDEIKKVKESLKSKDGNDKQTETIDIDDLWAKCDSLWTDSEIKKIKGCLHSHAAKLEVILGEPPPDFGSIAELIKRAKLVDVARLGENMKSICVQHVVRSPANATEWIDTLMISSAATKKISLVLELADRSAFAYPANHPKVQGWINSRLMAYSTDIKTSHTVYKKDAFNEPFTEAVSNKKFPDVDLPILGNVKLRAMNQESPCQKRYGHIDAKSFQTGAQARQSMKDALEWLVDPLRRGKTWQDASGTCGFTRRNGKKVPIPGMLLIYPSVLPEDPFELAGGIIGDSDAVKFEQCAERVTSALNLLVQEHPETEIHIFALAKADKARTKLLVSKRYEAKALIEAARAWQKGCNDIPRIGLNLGTNDKPQWVSPLIPFPSEVVNCIIAC